MEPTVNIQIRFGDEECAAIDNYRRAQVNPPTRPQAVRALVSQALANRQTQSRSDNSLPGQKREPVAADA